MRIDGHVLSNAEERGQLYLWLLGTYHAHSDGKVSRYGLRLWLAMFLDGFLDR